MPAFDFKCDNCGAVEEYIIGTHIQNDGIPEVCPKCNKGKLEKIYSCHGFNFDILGWSPDNEHGKKNWKRRLSQEDQVKVLNPDHNGQYKSPY